jgi:hypothetical protein
VTDAEGLANAVRRLPKVTAGLVAFAGTALGVLFLLVPSLKPLPRDRIEASIAVSEIQNSVGVKAWASRQFPGDTGGHLTELLGHPYGPRDRQGTGTIVYVRLTTVGFQHRSLNLRVFAVDARTHAEPTDLSITSTFPRAGVLHVDAPSRQSVQLLYIDDLAYVDASIVLRVEAYDDHGVLAYADSGVIRDGRLAPPSR